MNRVALYARYSSDLQSPASIQDQFRICRAQAEREGWAVAGTHHDASVSGASVLLMPGADSGLFDRRSRLQNSDRFGAAQDHPS